MRLYSFDDVAGHKNTKDWLKSKINQDKVPQVLLFCGLPGIGKTSIAKILACEIACRNNPELLDDVKESVIGEDKSTDCVKLYNMSTLKKDEEVANVKADLTVGFSQTGRKVVIMDEAHGMSEQAQDSLLTSFESLEDGVYIIICTTDITRLRDAFKSRCVIRSFLPPNQREIRALAKEAIDQRRLKFEISAAMAITYIIAAYHSEPRGIINLIDSLDNTKVVTKEDLESFGVYEEPKKYIVLINYLVTKDIVHGIEFIQNLPSGFQDTSMNILIEMTKVLLGGDSTYFDSEQTKMLRSLYNKKDIILQFVTKITTARRLTLNYICGVFIELCMDIHTVPEKPDERHIQDLKMLSNLRDDSGDMPDVHETSLDDLFMQGEDLV